MQDDEPYGLLGAIPVRALSDTTGGVAPPGPLNQQGEYSYGSFNRLPNYSPLGTYTGAIPTPDPESGQQRFPTGEAPASYANALALLSQQSGGKDAERIKRLLQILYQRGRT
jgi:hypothetical protein